MDGILWILFGLLPCVVVYFIFQQKIKTLEQNQIDLFKKISALEQILPQKTQPQKTQPSPPVIPPPLTQQLNTTDAGEAAPDLDNWTNNALNHTPNNGLNRPAQPTKRSNSSLPKLEPDERSLAVITSVWATLSGWFSGGNSIVRVGVLVLLIGVSLLLRLLNEKMDMPIELWLSLIIVAAVALTGLGWRLRQTRRGYALSLQGTGLAILYLTLFSAYRLYDLLPSQLTFILLAVLASLTALLSLRQDALPLALLGFGGAFFAPILTSTEQHQVVLLFSYYLLINLAVAWIAHQRMWKVLNLLGATATFGMALLWGWRSFDPALRGQMQLLLLAHVGLYLFIAVRYSQLLAKQPQAALPDDSPKRPIISVDSGLLFGVPLVAFGLQAGLWHGVPYALAISSAVLAVLYLGLAYWLNQQRLAVPLLREAILALGLGFLALILPLALDAEWTSTGWLIQGVALVWVGVRQTRVWQVVFGLCLQGISLLILGWLWLVDADQSRWLELLIASTTVLFSAALLRQPIQPQPAPNRVSSVLLLLLSTAIAVCLLQDRWSALALIADWQLSNSSQIMWDLLLLTTLGLLLSTRMRWQELRWLLRRLSLLIGALLVWLVWLDTPAQPLSRSGLLLASVVWLGLQLLVWWHLAQREVQSSQRWDQAVGLGCGLLLLSLWSFEFYPNAAAVVLLPIGLLLLLRLPHQRLRLAD